MSNNNQLPDEVKKQIDDRASTYARRTGFGNDKFAWRDGATEYATKLHQAQQEIEGYERWAEDYKRLVREIDNTISGGMPAKQASLCDLVRPIQKLQEKHNAAVTLLEKFISRYEAGLLLDRFIYNEIKTFLDGTKD